LGSLTRTLVADVEKKRSRTHSGVVAPVSVAPERKPAYCSVPHAGGEVEKSVLPLCRVEPGVAAVWTGTTARTGDAITKQASTKTTGDSDGITPLR
jgi:hypothetical protein